MEIKRLKRFFLLLLFIFTIIFVFENMSISFYPLILIKGYIYGLCGVLLYLIISTIKI